MMSSPEGDPNQMSGVPAEDTMFFSPGVMGSTTESERDAAIAAAHQRHDRALMVGRLIEDANAKSHRKKQLSLRQKIGAYTALVATAATAGFFIDKAVETAGPDVGEKPVCTAQNSQHKAFPAQILEQSGAQAIAAAGAVSKPRASVAAAVVAEAAPMMHMELKGASEKLDLTISVTQLPTETQAQKDADMVTAERMERTVELAYKLTPEQIKIVPVEVDASGPTAFGLQVGMLVCPASVLPVQLPVVG